MRPARGFSLIELMVASLLGLLVIGAAGHAFLQGARAARIDEAGAALDAELRYALGQMTADLEMAGYWGEALDPARVTPAPGLAPAADCGPTTDGVAAGAGNDWIFSERRASLAALGDASASAAHAAFPCIAASDFHAGPRAEGTDVIAVKRVATRRLAPAARLAGHVYLGVDGARGVLYPWPASASVPAGPAREFRPAIWFLRRASADEAAVPALCRKVLVENRGFRMQSDPAGCAAQGIEDLQVDLGLDDDGDGIADRQLSLAGLPAPETLSRVVSVRAYLLGRALVRDPAYVDRNEYVLGTRRHAPFGDGFRRRVQSATVLLRNPARLRAPPQLP